MRKIEHTCGIYCILNLVNRKRYIGQSRDIQKRWTEHIYHFNKKTHNNLHLQNAWHFYGENNFEFSILEECNEDELRELEIKWIAFYNTTNSNFGYNLTAGGDGVIKPSPELSKIRTESLKKIHEKDPERGKRVGEMIRKMFEEDPSRKEEYSKRAKEQFKNPEFYKKFREYRSSEEFKDKLRKANVNRRPPEHAIQKSKEQRSKPVRCVETGIIYPSAIEAARQMPGHININAVISGHRKTAGGYHWEKV